MHGFLRVVPEDTVDVGDRCAEELLKLARMGFKRGKILLSRPALVGDDHDTAVREGAYCRKVFAEPFVIENKVGGGIDGGVEVETEKHRLFAALQVPEGTDRHAATPPGVMPSPGP